MSSGNDPNALRQYAAIAIMVLGALLTAFLVVWSVVQHEPLSPIATTLGGVLIGYASHELGVSRGSTLSQQASAQGADQALSTPPPATFQDYPVLKEPDRVS